MKRNHHVILALTFQLFLITQWLQAQNGYTDFASLTSKLGNLKNQYPALCSVRSLATTAGGKDIWVITLGKEKKDEKPGIAIFGGVDGRYVLGRELALGFAAKLIKESSGEEISKLLEAVTFYIFPDVSPDASDQFFSRLKYERSCNARPSDDDRDFLTDEDGFEDLNKDGLITQIRISDPSGNYIRSSEDDRIMVKADPAHGDTGQYLVYSEGINNDKDELFNEDGPGGVNFNHNFSFNYEFFGQEAGSYPVSEPETKAVADFLFDRFNIFMVLTFGPQDNLGQPALYEDGDSKSPAIKSITKEDEPLFRYISDKYHEITGVKGAPATAVVKGNFTDWAYYHYGRYSFGTPAWWYPLERGKNPAAEFLKYTGKEKQGEVFVPWQKTEHPDFPGITVEVGGMKPFVMLNPPADSLEKLIGLNYRFIKEVAKMHPEPEFLDVKTETAGQGIYRLSLKLHNKGIFATLPKVAEENLYTRIVKITVEPADGQTILSGQKIQQVKSLDGGESKEFSWLVSGKGKVKITAGAVNTGTTSIITDLK